MKKFNLSVYIEGATLPVRIYQGVTDTDIAIQDLMQEGVWDLGNFLWYPPHRISHVVKTEEKEKTK